jgi:MYXO-CTERM domain-containing protein
VHAVLVAGLISSFLPLDVISTENLAGDITAEGGDYALVPFEVPAGTVEIVFRHTDNSEDDILDFGIRDPSGQRGWGGGLTEESVIGVEESTRGYMPGAIAVGTWYVDIGKAKLVNASVHYNITIELRDAATLTPRPRAEFEPAVLEEGGRWYAGDFHVHSLESGDATATFDQIRDLARARGLDWVNLSDHNIISQHALIAAYQAGVDDLLFLRGTEVTTYAGHGNTVGNSRYIDHHIGRDGRTIQDVLDEVEADGALFIVNHPKLDLGNLCIGCAWKHDDTRWEQVTGIELQTGAYLYVPIFEPSVLEMWDGLLDQGYRITGVSGSDDHRSPTEPPPTDGQIGTPTSLVWADELSEAGIMAGVRAGRVVVKLRGPDDPMVELTAETDRGESGMIGDTVTGGAASLEARVTGGAGMDLQLVRNGEIEETVEIEADEFTHVFARETRPEGDRYRLQLRERDGNVDIVVTNHVWVEYAEPVAGGPDAGPGGDGGGDAEGGCGCRTGGGGGGVALLIAAAALGGLRRRRSRR